MKKYMIKDYKLSELMEMCKQCKDCVDCPLTIDTCNSLFGFMHPMNWPIIFEKKYRTYKLSLTPDKLKEGDEVKLKEDLVKGKRYGGITLLPSMMFKGYKKIQKIIKLSDTSLILLDVADEQNNTLELCFSSEMLDLTHVKRGKTDDD